METEEATVKLVSRNDWSKGVLSWAAARYSEFGRTGPQSGSNLGSVGWRWSVGWQLFMPEMCQVVFSCQVLLLCVGCRANRWYFGDCRREGPTTSGDEMVGLLAKINYRRVPSDVPR